MEAARIWEGVREEVSRISFRVMLFEDGGDCWRREVRAL